MALSQEELKMVEQMKKLGATNSEISGFIGRSRAGIQSAPPIENVQNRNSAMRIVETGQDIAQGFQNILGIAKKTYGKQTEALNASIEGKQGLVRGLGQAFGAGAMGVSEGVGEVVKTGVKAGLSQEGEKQVKGAVGAVGAVAQPIMQSQTVQGLIDKYESLSDIQKRDLGAVLGVVALGTEFLGTGASKTAIKQVAKFIPEGQPFKNVDEVIEFATKQADETVTETGKVLKQTEAEMPDLSIKEKWIGLEPSFKKKIQGQPEKMAEYINVVKARNNDIDMPSVYEYAGDNARIAVADMERIINSTGSKIGQTRQKLGSYTLDVDQVKAVENTLVNQIKKLNLNLVEGRIVRDTGKISKISNAELTALQELYQNMVVLKRSPNLTNAIDLRNLFDKNINFGKSAREISGVLDPVSKATREEIAKQTARLVGKSEAKNLAEYSDFMRAYDDLKGFTDRNAGGEYLLRVFLSGRGGEASKVIKTIANYTGKDLSVDAVMMKLVTDFFANPTQKNLFAQEITRAGLDATRILSGDATGLIPTALNLAQKKLLNPEDILKEAAGVKKNSITPNKQVL